MSPFVLFKYEIWILYIYLFILDYIIVMHFILFHIISVIYVLDVLHCILQL